MLFSIIIDYDKDGHIEVWSQVKEKLSFTDQQKHDDLKARIERIVRGESKPLKLDFGGKNDKIF